MVLLEIKCSLQQWKNFANRSRTDKIIAMSRVAHFFYSQCNYNKMSIYNSGEITVFVQLSILWICSKKHSQFNTSAPSSSNVSISTAVWTVMCKQPAMRAPFRGLLCPCSLRNIISPGISFSAISIVLRPHSAKFTSAAMPKNTVYQIYEIIQLKQKEPNDNKSTLECTDLRGV